MDLELLNPRTQALPPEWTALLKKTVAQVPFPVFKSKLMLLVTFSTYKHRVRDAHGTRDLILL